MRKRNIFIIIFTVLLLVMSCGIVSLYDFVKENADAGFYQPDDMTNELDLLALFLVEEADSEYKMLEYTENVKETSKADFEEKITEALNLIRETFESDPDFGYQIKTASGQSFSWNEDLLLNSDDTSKYLLYYKLVFDENGSLSYEGNVLDHDFYETAFRNLVKMGDNMVFLSRAALMHPKNAEIIFAVPADLQSFGYVSSQLTRADGYLVYIIAALIGVSVILALLILFYPIAAVEEVVLFRTVKKGKGEVVTALLAVLICAGVGGCLLITSFTLTTALQRYLNIYHIPYPFETTLVLNAAVWLITMLFISLGCFYLKYILAHGLLRFLKEDTLTGNFCCWLYQKIKQQAGFDLSYSLTIRLALLMLLHLAVILILISLGNFGMLLAVVYALMLFFWFRKKLYEIQSDYKKLLKAASELAKGNFEHEIDEDSGIFNQLKNEFNHVRDGFERAVQEEIKSQNMKTELITNVSHDLKTPLTCIKNYIVLLQDENISEKERKDYFMNMEYYSNRLASLIEDLFEVSKVNSGNIQLNPVDLNIVALIEQVHAESEELLNSKNLKVISRYDKNEIMMKLDGGKTCRIFENLFTNIGKYAMPDSRVYVDVKDDEEYVRVELKNISEMQMNFTPEEIVERFVRGDKSRHESGSGLGLAIAQSFTEIQNGDFKIEIDGDLFKVILCFRK